MKFLPLYNISVQFSSVSPECGAWPASSGTPQRISSRTLKTNTQEKNSVVKPYTGENCTIKQEAYSLIHGEYTPTILNLIFTRNTESILLPYPLKHGENTPIIPIETRREYSYHTLFNFYKRHGEYTPTIPIEIRRVNSYHT